MQIQQYVKCLLNVQEHSSKRVQAINDLRLFLQQPNHAEFIRNAYEKLLPTLEQVLADRFFFNSLFGLFELEFLKFDLKLLYV